MKKLIICLCMLPMFAFGQRFELGLSYGPSFFAASTNSFYGKEQLNPTLYSALSLTMLLKGYDVSLRIGGTSLQYKYDDGTYDRAIVAANANEFALAINTRVNHKRWGFYGGVSGGAVVFVNPDLEYMVRQYPDAVFAASSGSGFMAGIQGGANYAFSRRFCLNAELGVSYTKLHVVSNYAAYWGYPDFEMDMKFIKVPVTLGVKYRFGIGAKYRYKKKKE